MDTQEALTANQAKLMFPPALLALAQFRKNYIGRDPLEPNFLSPKQSRELPWLKLEKQTTVLVWRGLQRMFEGGYIGGRKARLRWRAVRI